MAPEIVSVVLTGAVVLLGVWLRVDAVRTELGTRIEGVNAQIDVLADEVRHVAADVGYLRGRQDERDRRDES